MVTTNPIRYDNSKTEAELKQMKIDTINPYGTQVETEVGGLMSGGLQLKSNVELAWETDRKNACFWYKKVEVVLHIDPTIMVARHYKPGTCKFNAIIQHEMKHIATDQNVAKDWRPRLQSYLQGQIDRVAVIGPYPMAQQVAARAKLTDFIRTAMESASGPMNKDRMGRQQAIDTREEYDRVAALCD